MVDYNDGKWHGWNGGECPVHPESVVDVVTARGYTRYQARALVLRWSHDCHSNITAFRVTKPYVEPRKPREVWVALDGLCAIDVKCARPYDDYGYVRFREVLSDEV